MSHAAGPCPHDTLAAVDGLFGYYRCPACGDFFNLQLLNTVRHTPRDLAAVVRWLTKALNKDHGKDHDAPGDGDSSGIHTGD